MKITKADIDGKFRKSDWTHCYFKVMDVGENSAWGFIVDIEGDQRRELKIMNLIEEWDIFEKEKP